MKTDPHPRVCFPRSQTVFGNAPVCAILLPRLSGKSTEEGNGIALASAFPNTVWERGGHKDASERAVPLPRFLIPTSTPRIFPKMKRLIFPILFGAIVQVQAAPPAELNFNR